ncbi:hypothetical protein [Apilactobacillus timberlakei]|uniref:hypothetical protein n=1 Tax=Apilactobacillus timberlakei TaxID=2008380 RepID=UPI001128DA07|nr:hypothetical protein [Apilactobacillus timberlakei]TPR16739.1 hypothetical protein DYZ95_07095 [Apilactobacillus timberlakei]TPR21502.1 hypothetical protein DY083_05645 [Apilactobacillus timberlakei]
MGNIVRSMILILIAVLASSIFVAYGLGFMKDSISATTLQDAVQTATLSSNDKSARVSRGTYSINLEKFQDTLERTNIKEFDGKKPTYRIEVLTSSNGTNLDKNESYKPIYQTKLQGSKNADYNIGQTYSSNVYVKAVRVIANFESSKKIKNKDKDSDKQVSTFVVQNTNAKDDRNDLTA